MPEEASRAFAPWYVRLWRRIRYFRRAHQTPGEVFSEIYTRNQWGDEDSRSGPGSNLEQTEAIRRALPRLLEELGCSSLLDIPCGDFYWMKEIQGQLEEIGVDYVGGDIVPELVAETARIHAGDHRSFQVLDLLSDRLPRVDLVLCRDCLVHLSFENIFKALESIRASGAEYLLTTTFRERKGNRDILTGSWQPLNLEKAPFHLPPPLRWIDEECPIEGFEDKALGLWRVEDLPKLPS